MHWRPVKGFEDSYEVSDTGLVRSLPRTLRDGRKWKGKLLSTTPGANGYLRATLAVDGVSKMVSVHRLVLEAFVGPCPEGLLACHDDGDRTNSNLDNLRWDTISENHMDTIKHGRGLNKPVIRSDGVIYEGLRIAERETGISNSNISQNCRGLSKSAGGYKWRYYHSPASKPTG